MYHSTYAAIAEDAGTLARANEWRAMNQAIELLSAARADLGSPRPLIEAASYLGRLWAILLEDLASTENSLPEALRASLISIGLWVMREVEALRAGRRDDLDAMIDVHLSLRDSLA